jgi:hypothetical protein
MRSDGVDDTGRFVSEDNRQRARERSIGDTQVGVTDAAMLDPHPHLPCTWFLDFDVARNS